MELGTFEEVELIVDQIASNKIPPPNKAQSLVIIRQLLRVAKKLEEQSANIEAAKKEVADMYEMNLAQAKTIKALQYELEGTQDMAQFYAFLRCRPDWFDWDVVPVPSMPQDWKGHDDDGMKLDAAIDLVMGRMIFQQLSEAEELK